MTQLTDEQIDALIKAVPLESYGLICVLPQDMTIVEFKDTARHWVRAIIAADRSQRRETRTKACGDPVNCACKWPENAKCHNVAQRVPDEMSDVADCYAHKLALDLECVLADYSGKWYETALKTLSEYRAAMNKIHERECPTFMGEPMAVGLECCPHQIPYGSDCDICAEGAP